jgi:biotin carboxyl carrier protein
MSKLSVTIAGFQYVIETNFLPQAVNEVRVARAAAPPSAQNQSESDNTLHVLIPDFQLPVNQMEWLIIDGKPYEDNDLHWIRSHRDIFSLEIRNMEAAAKEAANDRQISGGDAYGDHRVKAPIPGLVTQVLVSVGEAVTVGQAVLTLEAMKMENEIRASRSGTVKTLNIHPGKNVYQNDVLLEID